WLENLHMNAKQTASARLSKKRKADTTLFLQHFRNLQRHLRTNHLLLPPENEEMLTRGARRHIRCWWESGVEGDGHAARSVGGKVEDGSSEDDFKTTDVRVEKV